MSSLFGRGTVKRVSCKISLGSKGLRSGDMMEYINTLVQAPY